MRLLKVALIGAGLAGAAPAHADIERPWFQGNGPGTLEPSATSLCLLVRIAGKFRGQGEVVEVVDDGKNWILKGRSKQSGVSAFARCVPWSRFTPAGLAKGFHTFRQQWQGSSAGVCVKNDADAWPGDAVTFVSGFGGQYRGTGEYLRVKPSASTASTTHWVSQTCRDHGEMEVSVTSFRVGQPGPIHLVRMIGPKGTGTAAQAGEYRVGPKQQIPLARADEALCGLTYVSGEFNGDKESVYLFQASGRWMLATTSQSGTGILAGARCVTYAQ